MLSLQLQIQRRFKLATLKQRRLMKRTRQSAGALLLLYKVGATPFFPALSFPSQPAQATADFCFIFSSEIKIVDSRHQKFDTKIKKWTEVPVKGDFSGVWQQDAKHVLCPWVQVRLQRLTKRAWSANALISTQRKKTWTLWPVDDCNPKRHLQLDTIKNYKTVFQALYTWRFYQPLNWHKCHKSQCQFWGAFKTTQAKVR